MCSKRRLQHSILQHLNPQWVIQRRRGRRDRLRTERTRIKVQEQRQGARGRGRGGRKSREGWKIRTESERMTTEVKTGLHVVYRSSHQRLH